MRKGDNNMLEEEKKIFTDEDAADAFYRFAGLEHEDISEDIERYKKSLR